MLQESVHSISIRIWNTVYLSQAIERVKKIGKYQEELLSHISPLGWKQITALIQACRKETSHERVINMKFLLTEKYDDRNL
ncbi:Tn3 family transposase [Bacillus rhizoplanae]